MSIDRMRMGNFEMVPMWKCACLRMLNSRSESICGSLSVESI